MMRRLVSFDNLVIEMKEREKIELSSEEAEKWNKTLLPYFYNQP